LKPRLWLPNAPTLLDYKDQELKEADFEELTSKVLAMMQRVRPDVVLTFGPLGISRHDDHITLHRAATEAFHRYRTSAAKDARLLYVAIPKEEAEKFEIVARAIESFRQDHEVIDVDGARVLFGDGWGLLRASNTEPVLVARYEARSAERLAEIQGTMEGWLRREGVAV
jgi:hypothetical protein